MKTTTKILYHLKHFRTYTGMLYIKCTRTATLTATLGLLQILKLTKICYYHNNSYWCLHVSIN